MARKHILLAALCGLLVVSCSDETIQSSNEAASCGNGKVEQGEGCDDGNLADGDGCTSECIAEDGYECPEKGGAC